MAADPLRPHALPLTRPATWQLVVAFALSAAWVLVLMPDVRGFLYDADWGHQLAGANQILLTGEHPFLDWHSIYGPLVFYASALGQVLSGGRAFGEVLLVTIAYSAGYTLFFALVRRLTRRSFFAISFTVLALLLMPRLYKYYVLVGPLLCLALLWNQMERPSIARRALVAVACAGLFLFRPDFGAYAALVALIGLSRQEDGKRVLAISHFLVAGVLGMLPWLAWTALHHRFGVYIHDTVAGSASLAAGMSVPFPSVRWGRGILGLESTTAGLMLLFSLIAPATLALVVGLRKVLPREKSNQLLACGLLGALNLIQMYHRSDFQHFLQAIPVSLISLAFLSELAWDHMRTAKGWRRGVVALPGVVVALCIWAGVGLRQSSGAPLPRMNIAQRLREWSVLSRSRQAVVNDVLLNNPRDERALAIEYLRTNTKPGQRILALPLLTDVYYFAERPFGGGQMSIAPGLFVSPEEQRGMVTRMRDENVDWLTDVPGFVLDGDERKRSRAFAPILFQNIDGEFQTVARFGSIDIKHRVTGSN
jgi:hypothetical protein